MSARWPRAGTLVRTRPCAPVRTSTGLIRADPTAGTPPALSEHLERELQEAAGRAPAAFPSPSSPSDSIFTPARKDDTTPLSIGATARRPSTSLASARLRRRAGTDGRSKVLAKPIADSTSPPTSDQRVKHRISLPRDPARPVCAICDRSAPASLPGICSPICPQPLSGSAADRRQIPHIYRYFIRGERRCVSS